MRANGWSVVPIVRHDHTDKGAGKRPAFKGWQSFAQHEAPLPSAEALRKWERSASGAPGTGVPCGSVIAIDIDVTDAALAALLAEVACECFGATPFIRQGRAPKVLLVYRAAEPMAKLAFKAADRTGDGLDIIAQGAQFVAFGIHPLTRQPYRWIGAHTPLTASPDEAPEITAAQIAAFIERARAILPLTTSQGGGRGPGGETAEIRRDDEGFVVDGREGHLTRLIWQAANDLQGDGEPLTAEAVTDRAWSRFCATARLVVGGREWTRSDAEAKAHSTLDRIRRRVIALGTRIRATEPTYPDESRPLADAEAEVRSWVKEFFTRHAPEFRNARTRFEVEHEANPIIVPPMPRAWCLKVEAGIGKTEAAIRAAASAIRRGLRVVYAVPRVNLGDEVIHRFAAHGVVARVYRGRDQDDPDAPGEKMCLNLAAVRDAEKAHVRSIHGAVCAKKGRPGERLLCPAHDRCGHIRQRAATPDVWVVPHALLFSARPSMILRLDALVIDESFFGGAIPDKPAAVVLDAIEAASLPAGDDAAVLAQHRARLVAALRGSTDGPMTRETLTAAGLTVDVAREAGRLEWRRAYEPAIFPGMDARARSHEATKAAEINRSVRALAGLWHELATFLDDDFPASGRLTLTREEKTGARQVERRSLRSMHEGWRAATLILDATAPPPAVLEAALGFPVVASTSIAATWSPHGRVRQIIGGPVSNTKLGVTEGREGNRRIAADLRRLIALRAALAWPRVVGVVVPKDFAASLTAEPMPRNVEVRHFGALAGLDRWRTAAGMIVIGRPAPTPGSMEAAAGVITGEPALAIFADDGRKGWYPRSTAGIRLATGSAVAVEHDQHPDALVDALRWQVCEANLLQAIGRLRPLRRDAASPFFLDIISDVPLPLAVDAVETWDEARPPAWMVMADGGMILTSEADIRSAYSGVAVSREKARALVETATLVERSIKKLSKDLSTIVRSVDYKRAGRFPPAKAVLLPNGPSGNARVRQWLEERVGPIASMTVERKRERARLVYEQVGRSLSVSAIARAGRGAAQRWANLDLAA
ncbi:bifunctional DNA primase/polymerase [Methylobacterium isbiliense]|uniref:DNA primase/polymerase bifunctional N-terminal domain-containing protein n=1 Tax=Methylobacterium isbiliense TaxID=315478 RepID=A0ABQ4S6I7_9HYPH|nr:bifunctional DNA primase/polymerase [Methylobacterium isbiliense]MDN3624863.1 bifunctional DNA primase/polymerase [Methylobacterium isbiliense]GJD98104.1 hypothetical protein GMJLKIPL_0010 [Methylobacterium isbiliense]